MPSYYRAVFKWRNRPGTYNFVFLASNKFDAKRHAAMVASRTDDFYDLEVDRIARAEGEQLASRIPYIQEIKT